MAMFVELTDALVSVYLRHLEDVLRGGDKTKAVESFKKQCSHYLNNIETPSDLSEAKDKIAELSDALLSTERDPRPARPARVFSIRTALYGILAISIFSASLYVSFTSEQTKPVSSVVEKE